MPPLDRRRSNDFSVPLRDSRECGRRCRTHVRRSARDRFCRVYDQRAGRTTSRGDTEAIEPSEWALEPRVEDVQCRLGIQKVESSEERSPERPVGITEIRGVGGCRGEQCEQTLAVGGVL
jgi:hypothetical protein